MEYCVIKDTTTVIDGSENSHEVMLQNAFNSGYTSDQVEILTAEQFGERKALEPQPQIEPSIEERLTVAEDTINFLLGL